MYEKTIKTDIAYLKENQDKILREWAERDAYCQEREKDRAELTESYNKIKANSKKLLNWEDDISSEQLFNIEADIYRWMDKLSDFTMKYCDDKLIFNFHHKAHELGEIKGMVQGMVKLKIKTAK